MLPPEIPMIRSRLLCHYCVYHGGFFPSDQVQGGSNVLNLLPSILTQQSNSMALNYFFRIFHHFKAQSTLTVHSAQNSAILFSGKETPQNLSQLLTCEFWKRVRTITLVIRAGIFRSLVTGTTFNIYFGFVLYLFHTKILTSSSSSSPVIR